MKCRVVATAAKDLIGEITPDSFYANVDPSDLACRESSAVEDWYHPSWFLRRDGDLLFTPPAFEFRNGALLGINGRHRAVLLARHMKAFPMLFVLPDKWPGYKMTEIMHKELLERDELELPDLPIAGEVACA